MTSLSGPPLWSGHEPHRLMASRDVRSSELVFPALTDASPLAQHHRVVELESVGRVYSFTVIHPSAKSGEKPYSLGYVDLPGPVRIFGRLQGKARPAIGDRYVAMPDVTLGYVFEYQASGDSA